MLKHTARRCLYEGAETGGDLRVPGRFFPECSLPPAGGRFQEVTSGFDQCSERWLEVLRGAENRHGRVSDPSTEGVPILVDVPSRVLTERSRQLPDRQAFFVSGAASGRGSGRCGAVVRPRKGRWKGFWATWGGIFLSLVLNSAKVVGIHANELGCLAFPCSLMPELRKT